MRFAVILSALGFLAAGPALAQSWQDYNYPDDGFSVSFPQAPKVESLSYAAAGGAMLKEQVYSVTQPDNIYRAIVIDYTPTGDEQSAAIDAAVKRLSETGTVAVNIDARVGENYGRQLSINGKDGSHTVAAIFFVNQKLYQIEGTVLASNPDPQSSNATRFQQSLNFGRGGFGGGRRGRRGGL